MFKGTTEPTIVWKINGVDYNSDTHSDVTPADNPTWTDNVATFVLNILQQDLYDSYTVEAVLTSGSEELNAGPATVYKRGASAFSSQYVLHV